VEGKTSQPCPLQEGAWISGGKVPHRLHIPHLCREVQGEPAVHGALTEGGRPLGGDESHELDRSVPGGHVGRQVSVPRARLQGPGARMGEALHRPERRVVMEGKVQREAAQARNLHLERVRAFVNEDLHDVRLAVVRRDVKGKASDRVGHPQGVRPRARKEPDHVRGLRNRREVQRGTLGVVCRVLEAVRVLRGEVPHHVQRPTLRRGMKRQAPVVGSGAETLPPLGGDESHHVHPRRRARSGVERDLSIVGSNVQTLRPRVHKEQP
jgi:hypothetical protein